MALSSHSPSPLGERRIKAPERTNLLARRLLVPSQTEWVRTQACCSVFTSTLIPLQKSLGAAAVCHMASYLKQFSAKALLSCKITSSLFVHGKEIFLKCVILYLIVLYKKQR